MTDIAVRVENLGKLYRIGQIVGYSTLRESLTNAVAAPFRRIRSITHQPSAISHELSANTIWALKDVSFEVKRGEAVGIIGRNGSGKSTLLKILSRITAPTEGLVEVRGRIASLLEVGTGFHPELTGRENIYLNGAVIGMKKAEVKLKFDEIVAFSEIEKFLDTPVKRYSSGMYVRLAFSVAAHLEPDILLLDEVLSVGDASFQKKCFGKMGDVTHKGKTVLFVSHNMAAVENLCQRGVVLDRGQIQYIGSQTEAIAQYLKSSFDATGSLRERTDRVGSGAVRVVGIEVKDLNGNALDIVHSGQDIDIYLHYEAEESAPKRRVLAGLTIKTQLDVPVFLQHNRLTGDSFHLLAPRGAFVCRIRRLPLAPAEYRLGYGIMSNDGLTGEYLDSMSDAVGLSVTEGNFFGSGEVPPSTHGFCLVAAHWRVESCDTPSSKEDIREV